jgi:hypothetical protein
MVAHRQSVTRYRYRAGCARPFGGHRVVLRSGWFGGVVEVPAEHGIEASELVGSELPVDAPDHVRNQVQFHLGLDLGRELCDRGQEHGELSVGHRGAPVRAGDACRVTPLL